MKKLIQRQKVPKYLKTHYTIVFIPEFEDSDPITVNVKNYETLKEQCGDWYITFPLKIGDYIFFGEGIRKVVGFGKNHAKIKTFGGIEKIPLKCLTDLTETISIKVDKSFKNEH